MTNKTALYALLAALALALLTNRWMTRGYGGVAFGVVSFDSLYFNAQWLAFAMTAGAMLLLASDWRESGRFPLLMLLGLALLLFFVATGIPQTTNSREWKSGDAGITRWLRLLEQRGEADEVAPKLLGIWKSGTRSYRIERDALTVTSPEGTETYGAAHCPEGIGIRFAYASADALQPNPAAYPYFARLEGPPLPSFEIACGRRLYNFIRLADGTALVFRDLHEQNPLIETLTR